MRFTFLFPDIGEGISEGRVLEWYVAVGQRVKMGEPLVKMETDKVVADIPSPKDGVVLTRRGNPGDVIRVGESLVELEIEGISPELAIPRQPASEKGFGVVGTLEVAPDDACLVAGDEGAKEVARPKQSAGAEDRSAAKPPVRKKALATPVARAMARELAIAIDEVPGTGPGGRVTQDDIKAYHQRSRERQPKGDAAVEVENMSQIRKAIARRMALSKQTAPHMTVNEEVEISSLIAVRDSQKENFARRGTRLTFLPFIIKAVVEALKKHKSLNSQLDMDKGQIIYKRYYNIGVAVDAPDGLVVPVIRDADRLSVYQLSLAVAEMAQKARDRKLTLEDLKDGTFSITNYGAIAGLYAVPIINYPEVAILGVGRFREAPIVRGGKIEIGNILPLSLSVDHRAVDGGEAGRFLKDIMDVLSDPLSSLLG